MIKRLKNSLIKIKFDVNNMFQNVKHKGAEGCVGK